MALRVDSLFAAIMTLYNTVNTFRSALTGGLHNGQARQGTSYPYTTFRVLSGFPDHLLDDTRMEEYRVTFNIFSKSTSLTEISNLSNYLDTLYDNGITTVSNYEHYDFRFDSIVTGLSIEDGIQEWAMDYLVTLRNLSP